MANINRHVISKEFRLGVKPEEREDITKDLLLELNEIDALTQQAADTAATFRQKIKERKEAASEMREQLERGKPQVLEVEECRNFGTEEIYWKSTKEQHGIKKGFVLEKRKMTEEDAQQPLPDSGEHTEDPEAEA